MKTRLLVLSGLVLFFCLTAHAQRRGSDGRFQFTLGGGVSELNNTFGPDANVWTPRFSYRGTLGWAFTDRMSVGLNMFVMVVGASNAVYLPTTSGLILAKQETKGERFMLGGLYVKVIPLKAVKRFSLQMEAGAGGYNLVSDQKYSGNGPGYGITAAWNMVEESSIRVEPYFSCGWSSLSDQMVDGTLMTGRSFQSFSLGLQVVLCK